MGVRLVSEMTNLPIRFENKIDFSGECWVWKAGKNEKGYGKYREGKKKVYAHRFSWECYNNRIIPKGMCILHSCDNTSCVNPDHLFLGTHQDNMIDKISKNRQSHTGLKGEENGNSKLTESQIIEIRKTYQYGVKGEFSTVGLSKKYGVSNVQIGKIVKKKHWINHVTREVLR